MSKMWDVSDAACASHLGLPLLKACFFNFFGLHHTILGPISYIYVSHFELERLSSLGYLSAKARTICYLGHAAVNYFLY